MDEHTKESVNTDENQEKSEQEVEVIDVEEDNKQVDAEEDALEDLKQEISRLQEEKEVTQERLLRVQAEFDNFKKRTQRERVAERKYKSQDLVNELLPALDNFERALGVELTEATESTKGIIEGITMVYEQLNDALKSQGVEVIETVGKEFDPNLHHAVMQLEDEEIESNIIVEELQKGYQLADRVIRAAMVKVNK